VPGIDGKRVAALEILIDTPYVRDLIKKGEVDTIKEAMERSTQEGGQTFDQRSSSSTRTATSTPSRPWPTPTAPTTCAFR
jgi:Tfp pilus assembly ATPase PilU